MCKPQVCLQWCNAALTTDGFRSFAKKFCSLFKIVLGLKSQPLEIQCAFLILSLLSWKCQWEQKAEKRSAGLCLRHRCFREPPPAAGKGTGKAAAWHRWLFSKCQGTAETAAWHCLIPMPDLTRCGKPQVLHHCHQRLNPSNTDFRQCLSA